MLRGNTQPGRTVRESFLAEEDRYPAWCSDRASLNGLLIRAVPSWMHPIPEPISSVPCPKDLRIVRHCVALGR